MASFLGIDTSNYTTSLAVFDSVEGSLIQRRRLLPVAPGSLGLRQSEALFNHVQRLPSMIEELAAEADLTRVDAVGVSDRPRNEEGSYMPCFLAGVSAAAAFAFSLGRTPLGFSHQQGHIAAVLFSAGRLDLLDEKFIAFHLSGGTTEAVLVTPNDEGAFSTRIAASSLDLKAGQAIDRVGVMLGLDFPAGQALEDLAKASDRSYKIKPFTRGCDCSFSGIENKCSAMIEAGEKAEDVARYCLSYVSSAVSAMAEKLLEAYGDLPLVFSGGVSANSLLRSVISGRYDAVFGEPALCGDNAGGIAVLTSIYGDN